MTKPDIVISYAVTDEDRALRQDPAFYVWDANAHQYLGSVTMGDREVRVFCDGEMRMNLWESKEARDRGDDPQVIRYCDRLMEAGIDTDAKLQEADEAGRIEWINNAWFDLYAYGEGITDGWLDCVDFNLDGMILGASEIIEDDETWKDIS